MTSHWNRLGGNSTVPVPIPNSTPEALSLGLQTPSIESGWHVMLTMGRWSGKSSKALEPISLANWMTWVCPSDLCNIGVIVLTCSSCYACVTITVWPPTLIVSNHHLVRSWIYELGMWTEHRRDGLSRLPMTELEDSDSEGVQITWRVTYSHTWWLIAVDQDLGWGHQPWLTPQP